MSHRGICVRKMTPEGLNGRRKMTALVRRRGLPVASGWEVDGASHAAVRPVGRASRKEGAHDHPAKDGKRSGDPARPRLDGSVPNHVSGSPTSAVAGWVYVASCPRRLGPADRRWHAAPAKDVELVMTPLRRATWPCAHDGRPVVVGELIHHSDAGSQLGLTRSSQHPDDGGVGEAVTQGGWSFGPAGRPSGHQVGRRSAAWSSGPPGTGSPKA